MVTSFLLPIDQQQPSELLAMGGNTWDRERWLVGIRLPVPFVHPGPMTNCGLNIPLPSNLLAGGWTYSWTGTEMQASTVFPRPPRPAKRGWEWAAGDGRGELLVSGVTSILY